MRDRKAYFKEWYAKNRERIIAKARAWEMAHPEEAREKKRKWQVACYSRYRQTSNYKAAAKRKRDHYKETLHDCYVRRVMAQHIGIKGSELPQTLVDAQRELMKLKRELKNAKL